MEGVCMGRGGRTRRVQDTVTRKLKHGASSRFSRGDYGDLVFWEFTEQCLFYKIRKSINNYQYNTQSAQDIAIFYCKADILKFYHFPLTITDTNSLHHAYCQKAILLWRNYIKRIFFLIITTLLNIY